MRKLKQKFSCGQIEFLTCLYLIASGLISRKCILEKIWRLKNAGSDLARFSEVHIGVASNCFLKQPSSFAIHLSSCS